ncbi:MAG: ExbD/TolR family protein, partial [Bacteroidia bacterium]
MRSKRKHRESEVSTDSLNDIMFFLLLFFLILSTMVSPNAIKVNLPKATPNVTVENEKKPIHLAVTKDRNYFLNNTPINKTELKT